MADLDKATREQLWKDPDWTCPKCGCVNFAIRNRCRNFWCDFDWDVNGGEGILVGICEVEDPMADLTAVTHESYDGPVCKFCGAVMTCLSCGGNMADPEQELREIAKKKEPGLLRQRFEIEEKYAAKCLAELQLSHDAELTIENAISAAIDEVQELGAQRKEAVAPDKCNKHAGDLIAGAMWYACVLPKGHEGEHRRGGKCFAHGEYVGDQCPEWPACVQVAAPPAAQETGASSE